MDFLGRGKVLKSKDGNNYLWFKIKCPFCKNDVKGMAFKTKPDEQGNVDPQARIIMLDDRPDRSPGPPVNQAQSKEAPKATPPAPAQPVKTDAQPKKPKAKSPWDD